MAAARPAESTLSRVETSLQGASRTRTRAEWSKEMTKREVRANARTARLRAVRRQQQRKALLRLQVITAMSCRRQLNPDQQIGARNEQKRTA
jgi:hypothetical protein